MPDATTRADEWTGQRDDAAVTVARILGLLEPDFNPGVTAYKILDALTPLIAAAQEAAVKAALDGGVSVTSYRVVSDETVWAISNHLSDEMRRSAALPGRRLESLTATTVVLPWREVTE